MIEVECSFCNKTAEIYQTITGTAIDPASNEYWQVLIHADDDGTIVREAFCQDHTIDEQISDIANNLDN